MEWKSSPSIVIVWSVLSPLFWEVQRSNLLANNSHIFDCLLSVIRGQAPRFIRGENCSGRASIYSALGSVIHCGRDQRTFILSVRS
jgi:hypothetical protein